MWLYQLLVAIVPTLIFLLCATLPVLTTLYFFRYKTRNRKSPLNIELLRRPGESLRRQIEEMTEDINASFIFLGIYPVFMYTVVMGQWAVTKKSPDLVLFTILAVILGLIFLYHGKKIYRLVKKRNAFRLGHEAEIAVGQSLQRIAKFGFEIFHDFPAQKNFNIDHIAVGPQGVFAIETKGRAKFVKSENNNWKVEFDGQQLDFPGWSESKPLNQASRQAAWLKDWIEKATGEKYPVTAVLAIPGWFVEQKRPSDIRLTNGKNFEFLTKGKVLLDDKHIRRISFQLEKMCRTVELRAYKKKIAD